MADPEGARALATTSAAGGRISVCHMRSTSLGSAWAGCFIGNGIACAILLAERHAIFHEQSRTVVFSLPPNVYQVWLCPPHHHLFRSFVLGLLHRPSFQYPAPRFCTTSRAAMIGTTSGAIVTYRHSKMRSALEVLSWHTGGFCCTSLHMSESHVPNKPD